MFEDTALFVRGVASPATWSARRCLLHRPRRPRAHAAPGDTAGVLRSVLEHSLHKGALPVKVWTSGPAFRYEPPQAGRYRQFYQFDLEAIGTEDPAVDAETIAVAWDAYQALGLRQYTLLLNSLGDKNCRPVYRCAAEVPARPRPGRRDQGADRAKPLRVLDDKRPEVRGSRPAPGDGRLPVRRLQNPLRQVRSLLESLGIPFTDAPRLVRGLNCYAGRRTSSTTRCSAPSRASAAAAGTTGFPRTSAGRRCPASGSRSAWTV